ncbi:septin-5 isoform X2 [Anolis carolinensis]|uniref:septin-5 isoform X2 n=1 Tax=Anolis carolinensis TaxID=28377 RepID=UPI002F2B378B
MILLVGAYTYIDKCTSEKYRHCFFVSGGDAMGFVLSVICLFLFFCPFGSFFLLPFRLHPSRLSPLLNPNTCPALFVLPPPSLTQATEVEGTLEPPEDFREKPLLQALNPEEPPEMPREHAIKRFLKDDSEEAELVQFLGDQPPAEQTFRRPEPRPEEDTFKGYGIHRAAPEMFAALTGARPLSQEDAVAMEDKEPKAFHRPRPLDLRQQPQQQQHMAAPAPPSPSRPRSPWGRLDPYDSDEDDKEYVGFATLPNQVHRKSVKRGFDFTLMVAGESGLGKSTLVNSLFLTDLYKDRKLLNAEERILQTVEITKHVVDIEEKGVKLRLTIVDTPGFGDAVNNTECWKPVADYIDQQFEQYFRDESGLNRKNIQDNRVHCCLYFISPFGHGLRPLDVEFMKALHQRVNIVPVLAKADTLMRSEVDRMKNKIRDEIEHFGIRIYQFPDCDSDEDDDFKLQDQELKESIPFAVIGSNTVVEAKGRRIRGRLYPWGVVEVENPAHCDFVKLRTMLVRTHMQDLKDVTRETHYENYRAQCIQSMTRMVVKERNRKLANSQEKVGQTSPSPPCRRCRTRKQRS